MKSEYRVFVEYRKKLFFFKLFFFNFYILLSIHVCLVCLILELSYDKGKARSLLYLRIDIEK